MSKILLWIVVIFALLLVLRLVSVAKARRERTSRQDKERKDKPPGPMVRCSECGVFLPKTDALPSPEGFRCADPQCAHRGGAAR